MVADQRVGALHRVSFDIYNLSFQIRTCDRLYSRIDSLAPTRRDKHVNHVFALERGALDFKIESHFLKGVGDVLVGLQRELSLHLIVAETRGHVDIFGDHRRACHGRRYGPELGARLSHDIADSRGHGIDVVDRFFVHRILGQRTDRVTFHAVGITQATEFEQLHRCGADIETQQRHLLTFS